MPRRHAFILALTHYEHDSDFRPLYLAPNDAELVSETLTKWCDYDDENIVVIKPAKGEQVSAAHVLDALRRFVERTGQGDTLLFFFAGHGDVFGSKAYIALPHSRHDDINETGISLEDVCAALRPKDRFCVRIFDCCHSGADARSGGAGAEQFIDQVRGESQPGQYVTLASCQQKEQSYEDPKIGHGIFTYQLCEAIKAVREGQSVRAGALYDVVYERVVAASEELGHSQNPVINDHRSGPGELARRRKSANTMHTADPQVAVELHQRIAMARSAESLRVINRLDELGRIAVIAKELFGSRLDGLRKLAPDVTLDLGGTRLMPEEWHGLVVKHFEGLAADSLHTLESYTLQDSIYPLQTILQPKRKGYVLYERPGLPDSVTRLAWKGDEYIPGGVAFCYVIPLIKRVYVLMAFQVQSYLKDESSKVKTFGRFGDLNDDWKSILEPEVEDLVERCTARIRRSTTAWLDYLDRENTLGS